MKQKLILFTLGCMLLLSSCGRKQQTADIPANGSKAVEAEQREDAGSDSESFAADSTGSGSGGASDADGTGSGSGGASDADDAAGAGMSSTDSSVVSGTGGTSVSSTDNADSSASGNADTSGPDSIGSQSAGSTETASSVVNSPAVQRIQKRLQEDQALAAIGYVGSYDTGEDAALALRSALSFSELLHANPFIGQIDEAHTIITAGSELYCLVPSVLVRTITITEYDPLSGASRSGKTLYQEDGNAPLLLICNESDPAGNTLITLESTDGQTIEYSPRISSDDGAVLLQEGILDLGLAPDLIAVPADRAVSVCGSDLTVSLSAASGHDGGPVLVTYRGQTLEVNDYAEWLGTSYAYRLSSDSFSSDSFYLLTVCRYASDWAVTVLVKYTPSTGLQLCDEVDGSPCDLSVLNPENVMIRHRADCFGTYSTFLSYSIEEDRFEASDTYLDFRNTADPLMASYRAEAGSEYLQMVYDEQGFRVLYTLTAFESAPIDGNPVTIPAGSFLYPRGCDLTRHLFYFICDGQLLFVEYEKTADSYHFTIDGVDQGLLFHTLPYAG